MDVGYQIILTIGLPRSGKSSWAVKAGMPIINRDSIRKAIGGSIRYFEEEDRVSEIENIMAKSLFYAGHKQIIVDATHIKLKHRLPWIEIAKELNSQVWYKIFPFNLDLCIQRAINDFPKEADNFIKVIENMYENFRKSGDLNKYIYMRKNPWDEVFCRAGEFDAN